VEVAEQKLKEAKDELKEAEAGGNVALIASATRGLERADEAATTANKNVEAASERYRATQARLAAMDRAAARSMSLTVLTKIKPNSTPCDLGGGVTQFMADETRAKRIRFSAPTLQERVIELGRCLFDLPQAPAKLYIRECYEDMWQNVSTIFQMPRAEVFVTGTRGIGKSVFGAMVALKLVEQGKIVLYEHQRAQMMIVGSGEHDESQISILSTEFAKFQHKLDLTEGVYVFRGNSVHLFESLLVFRSTIHVQDLDDNLSAIPAPSGGGARKLILCSPDDKRTGRLRNRCPDILVMPLWTPAELEAARQSCFPQVTTDHVTRAIKIFGGVPRSVLEWRHSEQHEWV
jgi:hypothetical protein